MRVRGEALALLKRTWLRPSPHPLLRGTFSRPEKGVDVDTGQGRLLSHPGNYRSQVSTDRSVA